VTSTPANATDSNAAIHRLAANLDGQQLVQAALNHVTALLAQHQIQIESWGEQMDETIASGCRCPDCTAFIQGMAGNIARATAAKERLQIIGDALTEIDTNYPQPTVEDVADFMGSMPPDEEEVQQ
jgi:hypothetical protein